MVISQGEIWWADLPAPAGSGPGFRRPVRKDSVANVSQVVTVDKELFTERVGRLPRRKLELLLSGIDVVLGR